MSGGEMFRPRHLLVTGGSGFIGSNFVRHVLETDSQVCISNLDCLAYSGNPRNLDDVERRFGAPAGNRYRFVRGDIRDGSLVRRMLETQTGSGPGDDWPEVDAIAHLAAQTHVDRSILDAAPFVETNVNGTASLLEAARDSLERSPRRFRFLHASTDEVYGSLGPNDPPFTEQHPLAPTSPYAASKAGADMLVNAFVSTYQLPAVITRCANNYGPYQYPEKLVPLMIVRALARERLPVYGDGRNVRDWIHVLDHCDALWCVLGSGTIGGCYNIGAASEITNLEVVETILARLDCPRSLVQFVADRPGHDRRYAIDNRRLVEELGWQPSIDLARGLETAIDWYREHSAWWRPLLPESQRAARELYRS